MTNHTIKINHAFCDFDDTITKNTCLLFTKYKFLTQNLHYSNSKAYNILKKSIQLNPTFFDVIKKYHIHEISILSLNDEILIKKFCSNFSSYFLGKQLVIKDIYSGLNKEEKYKILPKGSVYIADIFEYSYFIHKKNIHFICIDGKYSIVKYRKIFIKKLLKYIIFRFSFLNGKNKFS